MWLLQSWGQRRKSWKSLQDSSQETQACCWTENPWQPIQTPQCGLHCCCNSISFTSPPPPAKKAKLAVEERTCDNFDDILEPKTDDKNNNIVAFVSADFSSVPSKIDEMSKILSALKSSMDSLQASKIPEPVKEFTVPAPIDDRIEKLVLCKSVENILINFCELSYDENEKVLKCDLCSSKPSSGGNLPGIFSYSKDIEPSSSNQSQEFRSLKHHLKNHFTKKVHIDNWEALKLSEDEERKFTNRCFEVGMRISRLCYDIYKEGYSAHTFEKEVWKATLNWIDMGDINHSRNFPDKFRPFVAAEVRNRTTDFLSSRLLRLGFY